jgi:spectinomycin phosphotransferase
MAKLLAENEAPVRRLLAHYDELVTVARRQPSRAVLTHGEPHPGNTMLTSQGWVLIDWDTALVAPPERDLWGFDAASLDAYAEMTGVRVLRSMVELYRLRWDLADIAASVHRFRRPHTASPDDVKSWEILRSLVTRRPP